MTSAMPEQHRSPYWADDWTIGPVRVWPPARALLWCAGVDSTLLRTQAEALRYSGLGALVVAVAALGATTFSIFTAVVIGHFRWYLVPFGLASRLAAASAPFGEHPVPEILDVLPGDARGAALAEPGAAGLERVLVLIGCLLLPRQHLGRVVRPGGRLDHPHLLRCPHLGVGGRPVGRAGDPCRSLPPRRRAARRFTIPSLSRRMLGRCSELSAGCVRSTPQRSWPS